MQIFKCRFRNLQFAFCNLHFAIVRPCLNVAGNAAMAETETVKSASPIPNDIDPAETAEWLESLDYVLERKGLERVQQLLTVLEASAIRNGVELPFTATTPYVNTIPPAKQRG